MVRTQAIVMRNAANNVAELVIPNAGHWLMEEQPEAPSARFAASLTGSVTRNSTLIDIDASVART